MTETQKKTSRVYKVVRLYTDPKIMQWHSYVTYGEFAVLYCLGETTRPVTGSGPLMAFRSLRLARQFVTFVPEEDGAILYCDAEITDPQPASISEFPTSRNIGLFWQGNPHPYLRSVAPPIGTVFCDSITPRSIYRRMMWKWKKREAEREALRGAISGRR
jgi:hypothetical protein